MGRFARRREWLQSDFVLPTARTVYLIGACVALIAVVLGVVAALYFQLGAWRTASEAPLPPPYESKAVSMQLQPVEARLQPPGQIGFAVIYQIERPLNGYELLGYFTANSPNAPARYPDDFNIIGGRDASLFERTASQGRSGLRPSAELVRQINASLPTLLAQQPRTFELRVIARDQFGNRSTPVNISFTVMVGPPPPNAPPPPLPVPEPTATPTPLQLLARDIAQIVDPQRTPAYFDAYKRALALPRFCGTSDTDTEFVSNYRRAFDHVRKQLTPQNVTAFSSGVCDAWNTAIAVENSARQEAEAARARVVAANENARFEAEMEKLGAAAMRNYALSFVGAALIIFLTIALVLAFLAIEGHSRAMRIAIETLTGQGRPPEGGA